MVAFVGLVLVAIALIQGTAISWLTGLGVALAILGVAIAKQFTE